MNIFASMENYNFARIPAENVMDIANGTQQRGKKHFVVAVVVVSFG